MAVPGYSLTVEVGAGPEAPPSSRPRSGLYSAHPWRYTLQGDQAADNRVQRARLIDLDVVIETGSALEYAIYAEFGGNQADPSAGWGATAAAVDLLLDDGTRLSDHRLRDHHGFIAEVDAQTESRSVVADQWTAKRVDLSALAGRRVVAAELVLDTASGDHDDRPATGWLDGVQIERFAASGASELRGLVEWVSTTRGSHASGRFSRGNTAPLTTLPHGAAFAIPLTDASSHRWPYAWSEHDVAPGVSALQGFAVSHIASPWMADRSIVQLCPGGVEPVLDRAARARRFRHRDEIAQPHRYAVAFEDGSGAELTTTSHVLLLRLTFADGAGTIITDGITDGAGDAGELGWSIDGDGRGVLSGWVDGPSAFGAAPVADVRLGQDRHRRRGARPVRRH